MKKPQRKKAKFSVGQVVRIDTEFKRNQGREYLRVESAWPWLETTSSPWGYTLSDKDRVSERFVRPLTKRERGK